MFCMFCILSRFNRDRAGTTRSLPEGVPYNKSALQILRDDIQVGKKNSFTFTVAVVGDSEKHHVGDDPKGS